MRYWFGKGRDSRVVECRTGITGQMHPCRLSLAYSKIHSRAALKSAIRDAIAANVNARGAGGLAAGTGSVRHDAVF